jgi:hypothetical protein
MVFAWLRYRRRLWTGFGQGEAAVRDRLVVQQRPGGQDAGQAVELVGLGWTCRR